MGDNLGFGGNFNLRGGSVRGATRLPGFFFLNFFYSSYIVNFFLIVLYIY